jgi:hypothetical protein
MKKLFISSAFLVVALFSTLPTFALVQLTQTSSQTPIYGTGISCGASFVNTANQYMRVYDLATHGITTGFTVTKVEFGIEECVGPNGSGQQPVMIKIYTLSGPLAYGNMTLKSSTPVTVFDGQSLTTQLFNIVPTFIPAGSVMVVEYSVQDNLGMFGNGRYYPGANGLGQTGPSYFAASDCGIPNPLSYAAIGFPDSHLIINAYGEITTTSVPVANWALYLAIGMMVVVMAVAVRRRFI